MGYKIRVILDVEDDVFRDIVVDENLCLEDLHYTIAKSFGFNGQEMASFYRTDDQWEQGEEIPLFDMSEDGSALSMHNCSITSILKKKGDKLIYVYDFFSMWTFFIELKEVLKEKDLELPKVVLSFGNVPEEAPEKEFKAEDDTDFFYDDENDDDIFEDLDDFDIENY